MGRRQAVALLALIGLLVSVYLTLHQLGMIGPLACGTGGCERVQSSRWAYLAGVPVGAVGVAGYLAILVVAMWGLQRPGDRRPARWLVLLAAGGVLFTLYLMYLEAFVIHAWCRWCLGSAAIITLTLAASLLDLRASRA